MSRPALEIEHARLGRIRAEPGEVFAFPGVPGFPNARRFVVRAHDRGTDFGWLVCLDVPDLAFCVADPWTFAPHYAPTIHTAALRTLGYVDGDELQALAIASFRDGRGSLNLAAPVLLDLRSRRGIQILLDDDRYPTREPLPRPDRQIESNPGR